MNELIDAANFHHRRGEWLATGSCWWAIARELRKVGKYQSAKLVERIAKAFDARGLAEIPATTTDLAA